MAIAVVPLERDGAGEHVNPSESLNFDLIYRNYGPALRAFCRSRLGNVADADDACQEAMLRAYRARDRFRHGSAIWPWLATIAANVCIDMQRVSGRTTTMDELGNAHAPSPEYAVERRMQTEVLETAVRGLPDRYRNHVYWRDYEGWSYEEMARVEGTSVASVRTTLMRARRALRDRVETVAASKRVWPLSAAVPFVRGFGTRWRTIVRDVLTKARGAGPDQISTVSSAFAAAVMTAGIVVSAAVPAAAAAPAMHPAVTTAPLAVRAAAPVAPPPAVAAAPVAAPSPARATRPAAAPTPTTTASPATTGYRATPVAVGPPPTPDAGVKVGPVWVGCPTDPHAAVAKVICTVPSNP